MEGKKQSIGFLAFALILISLPLSFAANEKKKPLTPDERLVCTQGLICTVKKESLDFFVVGDTGGISFDASNHIKFLGFTKPTQTQLGVALAMGIVAQKSPIDFVINVGDNVYWNGVDSVDDYRFKSVFEGPYDDKNLEVPWYMIGGNHDHLGNMQAQIDYTKKSNKWTFPNYYYKTQYAFGKANTRVDYIFLDTIVLCGNTFDVDGRSLFSWIKGMAGSLLTAGREGKPEKKYEKLAEEQWKWIEEELKKSTADYLFVVGHYPIYTTAERANKCLMRRLDPLLRKYKVNAYFSGHDHNLQHHYDDGTKSGSEIHYVISGAGSRIGMWGRRFNPSNIKLQYVILIKFWVVNVLLLFKSSILGSNTSLVSYPIIAIPITELGLGIGGFASFSINSQNATLKFYGTGLIVQHQSTFKPRKLMREPKVQ